MSSWKLERCAPRAYFPARPGAAWMSAQHPKPLEDGIPASERKGGVQRRDLKCIRKTMADANADAMHPIHFME